MFIDRDFRAERPLPSDVTLRAPVYRRQGIIASLLAGLVRAWSRYKEAREISRFTDSADELPSYLRKDIGLPRAAPPSPGPWDLMRW